MCQAWVGTVTYWAKRGLSPYPGPTWSAVRNLLELKKKTTGAETDTDTGLDRKESQGDQPGWNLDMLPSTGFDRSGEWMDVFLPIGHSLLSVMGEVPQ